MGASDTLEPSADIGPPVVVSGEEPLELTSEVLASFAPETRDVTVVCATGDRHSARWTGLPVADLLERAEVPLSTTHVVIESTDEYRVAIPVRAALEGLLAYEKDGVPIGRGNDYGNRFVSGVAEGARHIKGVRRIDSAALGPKEDPERLENLFPDGERFTAHRYDKTDPEAGE